MYNIGTCAGIFFVPFFMDRYGRKFCVILGSIIAMIGIVIQTIGVNREQTPLRQCVRPMLTMISV